MKLFNTLVSFLILIIFFCILTIWVKTAISSIYRDIFVFQNFMEKNAHIVWYHWIISFFITGIPLWTTTVYYIVRKLQSRLYISYLEAFYFFGAYLTLILLILVHLVPAIISGIVVAIHLLFLILIAASVLFIEKIKL